MSQEKTIVYFFVLDKSMQCSHSNPKKLTSVCLEITVTSMQFKNVVVFDAFFPSE